MSSANLDRSMSMDIGKPNQPRPVNHASSALRKTKFDSVSNMLLAVLIFVSMGTAMLLMIWWDRRVYTPVRAMEILVENPAGRGR